MTTARKRRLTATAAMALCAGMLALPAHGDDIDIYSSPAGEGFRPNVLFILDNSANWSASITLPICDAPGANVKASNPNREEGTKFGAEKCALYKVISGLPVEDLSQFNIGIMLFNESPDSAGYPRQAFTTVTNAAEKTALLNKISSLGINADKTNNASTAETFYEAYLWFNSMAVRLGNKTATKHDAAAFADASKIRYRGPAVGCAKNHIIYLANGRPGDNNNTAESLLKLLNPNATRTKIPTSENVSNSDEANWADEFAAFFNRGADLSTIEGQQNISVHAIAVTGASSDGNYPNFIRWIAKEGGGLYQSASDTNTMMQAVTKILNQIRASNSVFASASLPVSANTQGTYLNQVFIGMFRPDGNALPRWVGNLKQYQFKYNAQTDSLQMADANQEPAISPTSGFVDSEATSFWTTASTFWIKQETASAGKFSRSDAPDGELVEKGGIAQWLRTQYLTSSAARPIYTCPGTCGTDVNLSSAGSGYQFSTANASLTPALFGFGAAETTKKNLLINWMRGDENVTATNVVNESVAKDQLGAGPDGSTVRPSIHGDVLHSRPIAINYGSPRGVVVFYGSNDGMLRAINGNQSGPGAGTELWSFVAPDHFGTLNRLRENDPEIRFPSTPIANLTARQRDYFFDGPLGFYQNTNTDEVIIFVGMRRGGRAVYAFNVSDPTQPRLLWRVAGGAAGYENLGQTWSMAKVAPVKGRVDPVLIMGGGYDNVAEDATPPTANVRGRGVYVMDMRTGARLAWLPTDYSVPSDIAVVDIDGDGDVDRAYLADIRAQVYRIDVEPTDGSPRDPSAWVITKIAALNDGAGGTNGTRRVFFAPDLVVTRDYMTVLLGTGNRERPLATTSNDRFFVVKDTKVSKGEPTSVSLITEASLSTIGADGATTDPDGCMYVLNSNGEKVINQPITFGGITYFSTNRPSTDPNACTRSQSRAYQLPLVCKPPKSRNLIGDGLPPSPVVGYVDVGGGKLVPFVIGGPNDNNSAIEASRAQILVPGNRRRSYWYIENRDR